MSTYRRVFKIGLVLGFWLIIQQQTTAQEGNRSKPPRKNDKKQYSIEQAISEQAQLNTAAFSGLAFITGSFGVDCFFPPGKVADYFGFQYMRDIDKNEKGHNTDFLTLIASNVISILTKDQLQQLMNLANDQAPNYDKFARERMILIKAFRDNLEGKIPSGKKELSKTEVIKYCSKIYEIDASLSYERAVVVGKIINSFTKEQKDYLSKLEFSNSSTWPKVPETLDKRSLSHRAHVCVMTYASELFSWYAGSTDADVYFCPERHGTYFGGFYLKDFPAMGNPNYNISTALTGDKGRDFINILTDDQANLLKRTVRDLEPLLHEIVKLRREISIELRKAILNQIPNKEIIVSKVRRYGEIDGELSYEYAKCFAKIYQSLSENQLKDLIKIRDLKVMPKGTYLFSDPIDIPDNLNCDFLFY